MCKSAPRSRQITTPAPHHSVFYRPDALPAAQPTASKHWRQSCTNAKKTVQWQMLITHELHVSNNIKMALLCILWLRNDTVQCYIADALHWICSSYKESFTVIMKWHISTWTSFAVSTPTHSENNVTRKENSSNLQCMIHQMSFAYIPRVNKKLTLKFQWAVWAIHRHTQSGSGPCGISSRHACVLSSSTLHQLYH